MKLRYHAAPVACRVATSRATASALRSSSSEPAHAVAPGQIACLLREDASWA